MAKSLIRVGAEVDKSVITIGDRIIYTLTIEHDKSIHVEQPGPGANLGQFEIKDYRIYDPVEKNGLVVQKFEYNISVFDTGKFVIPPFPVAFSESDTSRDFQIIMSEPIEIFVESVLADENAEIRDIKPPIPVPYNYKRLILIILGALLLLAAAGITYYVIRQRKKGMPLFRKEVIRPAHEVAFEALVDLELRWRSMFENEEYKPIFWELSDILRRYLENRFFINALEETTFEIRISLEETGLNAEEQEKVREVLELADLVKFAKYVPQLAEVENSFRLVREFIDSTKLIFEKVEQKIPVDSEMSSEVETLSRPPVNESRGRNTKG
ncbi:MAG: hypothetical protein Kow0042_04710 [Calditrichia bacterium]